MQNNINLERSNVIKMSWNFNKDKNKDQPKRKGAKGKFKSYIIFPILFILKK